MCEPAKTTYLADYKAANFLVEAVELTFDLDITNTQVTTQLTLYKNPIYTDFKVLELNGEELEIIALSLADKSLTSADYEYKNNLLTIKEPPQSGFFVLTTQVRINPSANTQLSGLYKSSNMLSTQCEAEGFRRITFYPDRPDVLTRFTTKLIADKTYAPVLLSNGNLIEQKDLPNNKHYAVWQDPFKKPSYLFALVAGDLVCVEDSYTSSLTNREISLKMYVEPQNKHKCEYALTCLKNAMLWDEQTYGREYDLSSYMIVAVSDFNMGAMENKGLNIFNTAAVLVDKISSTDAAFRRVESVVGHEYFHNWTGNRITCRDWFQLSLKEGFTVFREQSFCAAMNSEAVQRIEDVNFLRSQQFAEDAGALSHPVRPESYMEINNFYTKTIYEKGAEVIRILRNLVGQDTFRKATDLYFTKFDGMAVQVEDLIACVETAADADLSQFILWYNQAGTPLVKVNGAYDSQNQTLTLDFEQFAPKNHSQNQPLIIPIAISLLYKNASDSQLAADLILAGENLGKETVLKLDTKKTQFVFSQIKDEVIPSLLRNFSAPIKLEYQYSQSDLGFLMAKDTDEFNRWEAAQQLYLLNILNLFAGKSNQLNPVLDSALTSLFAQEIVNPEILSLIFSLPSYDFVIQTQAKIQPLEIYATIETLKTQIAQKFYRQWHELFARCEQELQKISDFDKQIAWRKLKILSLSYILRSQNKQDLALARELFADKSKGMTERYAGLNLLLEWADAKEYKQALTNFAEQWQSDQLVMDMWFTAQAARKSATIAELEDLFSHELFNIKNPNRLRSLLVPFMSNPLNFHRQDGSGYKFLVDKILQVDKLNSQMSAALTKKLAQWQDYAEPYASLMYAELTRLAQSSPSLDVYEILDKTLKN